jgi:hypothetical protein
MAPHWKCGSGQPVAGSNPALSATSPGARPRRESSGRLRPHGIRATMKDVGQGSASAAAIRETGQSGAAELAYRGSGAAIYVSTRRKGW